MEAVVLVSGMSSGILEMSNIEFLARLYTKSDIPSVVPYFLVLFWVQPVWAVLL